MANELNISLGAPGTVFSVIRRASDGYAWDTPAFEAWNDADFADYAVALTHRGGNYFSADFPALITASGAYVVDYYKQLGATPDISDLWLDSETIQWTGSATIVTTPGDGSSTVGELVTILRTTCRNAGINDADELTYDLTTKHLAIRALLEDFVRRTRCVTKVDTFAITSGSTTVTLAGITGMHTERINEIWISGDKHNRIAVSDITEVDEWLACSTNTHQPCKIGFTTTAGVGRVFPTPDANYTASVRWWPDVTAWTPGDTGVASLALNIPGDLARSAVYKGGIWFMQKNQPEHAKIVDQSQTEYEAFVTRNMGAGNLGVRSLTRQPLRRGWR